MLSDFSIKTYVADTDKKLLMASHENKFFFFVNKSEKYSFYTVLLELCQRFCISHIQFTMDMMSGDCCCVIKL